MALTDARAAVPSARDLRSLRRGFARRHAPRGDRVGTILLLALGAYVAAGSLWWLAHRPATVLSGSVLFISGPAWSPTWAWSLGSLAIGAGLAIARALGPVTTSPEDTGWLLSTPVDRAALLRPRLLLVLGLGATAGLIVGRLAAFAGAVTGWLPVTGLGATAGVGVVAVAALAQCRVLPVRVLPISRWVFLAAGACLGAAAAVGVAVPVVTSWWPVLIGTVCAGAAAAISLLACGRIGRADLAAGADLAVGAGVSMTTLDITALAGILDVRAWRRIGKSRSRRLPPGRVHAMIRADLLRHLRRPSSFAIAAAAVGLVWTVASVGTVLGAAMAQLGAASVVALVFSSGLRELCTNDELRMMLGVGDRPLRLALLVVPLCAVVCTASLTAPAVHTQLPIPLIASAGALLAAYRLRTRPWTAYDGLILETGYGQVPVDLLRRLMRGPDVLVVTAVLLAAVVA
ncbi:DUF6297 family protein [Rhodococcus kronopolitis]|uniref:DUF6297 family protein n=1 Tax=Rhodococcus kronopolitis TaxID=1460226 RepID=A0ABV9FT68_9NOCA